VWTILLRGVGRDKAGRDESWLAAELAADLDAEYVASANVALPDTGARGDGDDQFRARCWIFHVSFIQWHDRRERHRMGGGSPDRRRRQSDRC
jgi:hypothetical protein